MDSSLIQAVIGGGGAFGIVVVMIILRILVPGWYVKKLEQQNEVLTTTAQRAVSELALANQMVGELRAIALQRAGPAAAPVQGGAAGDTPVAQEA